MQALRKIGLDNRFAPPRFASREILDPPLRLQTNYKIPAVFVPESNHVTQLVDDNAEDGAVRTEGDDLAPGTLPPHKRTTPAIQEKDSIYNGF